MRRAPRKDLLHPAVVNILTRAGWEIHDLAAVGDGWPDLLGFPPPSCLAVWVEVKSEQATRHGRRDEPLRASQEAWRAEHPRAPYELVDSVEAAWKLDEKYNTKSGKAAR